MFKKTLKYALRGIGLLLCGPALVLAFGNIKLGGHWAGADRSPAGIAPDPANTPQAVIQVYAARAFSWRGAFGTHTWIAAKRRGALEYRVYQVLGWRNPTVQVEYDIPDRVWYGQMPQVLLDKRGGNTESLIDKLDAASLDYPYPHRYTLWPGPNSNTFTAFLARQVPELGLKLPPTAIGKDFLPKGVFFAKAPSGSGGQFSFYGLFGITLALEEGIEFNLLGMHFGIDPLGPALKLPGIGYVGWP